MVCSSVSGEPQVPHWVAVIASMVCPLPTTRLLLVGGLRERGVRLTLPSWSTHRTDSSLHSSVPRRSGWLPRVAASAPSPSALSGSVRPGFSATCRALSAPSTFPRQLGILLRATGHSPPSSAVEEGAGFGGGTLRRHRHTRGRSPAPPLTCCVSLGPLLSCSELWVLRLLNKGGDADLRLCEDLEGGFRECVWKPLAQDGMSPGSPPGAWHSGVGPLSAVRG